ncbi:hypothetical protein M2232_004387 [Bradyrhizobium japonicum]|nr:hypothetical protein [Bradyrhizobium japonicum]MCS3960265.1 hypothetical protein [Bradyrhizobium japonicum]MCS3978642.1 hypothetical protein [Bradyrhizobium japonicum]MCS4002018.1 hypothetical protein [Bradyrhizobium japonicum]MCW2220855.1 hypothetical protein [Bradyrhizobium japonicum]
MVILRSVIAACRSCDCDVLCYCFLIFEHDSGHAFPFLASESTNSYTVSEGTSRNPLRLGELGVVHESAKSNLKFVDLKGIPQQAGAFAPRRTDSGRFGVAAGEDHGEVGQSPQAPSDVRAAHSGHREIEYRRVRRYRADGLGGRGSAFGDDRPVAKYFPANP